MQRPAAERRTAVAAALASAVVAIAVYVNALHPVIQRDDIPILLLDERIHAGDWVALLFGDYWPPNTGSIDRLYRPLTSLSFAAQRRSDVAELRFVNVLLHAAVSALVCHWATTQWSSASAGLAAGLLFAVHPIHTEALNLVVGRADVAATLFALAALMTTPRRPVLGSVLFAVALLCKEQVVLLPLVLLLTDRRGAAAWMFVVVLYLGLRFAALGTLMRDPSFIAIADNVLAHPETDLPSDGSVFLARWATPVALFGKAAALLVWPEPLCNDYSYGSIIPVRSLVEPRFLFGAAALIAAATAFFVSRLAPIKIGLAWALAGYAVVSNGPILIGTIFGERLLYLPSAGVCLAAGGLVVGRWRTAFAIIVGVLVIAGAARVVMRNADWRTPETLVQADLPKQPRSCRLLTIAAMAEWRADRPAAALDYCRQASEVCPSFPTVDGIIGLANYRLGNERAALEAFQRSFRRGGDMDETAVLAAADLLVKFGDAMQAIGILEKQLDRFPMWTKSRTRLAELRKGGPRKSAGGSP